MADESIRGRFVWHELVTPDTAGAHEFYSKALGWKTERWDQDPSYSMFVGPNGPLGGSVAEPNSVPQWLAYIGVDDVAAAIERAKDLGGGVVKELTGMANGGTYAVIADPQGAQFGIYASTSEHGPETAAQPGEFSWHELATGDYAEAFEFYSALFGWEQIDEHDMGALGKYFIFGVNGEPKGGMFNKPPEMKGDPMWIAYVRVKDVNVSVSKVKSGRGTLINEPMEVPGGDWIAQFLDPYGAIFALHTVAADVKSSASATPREEETLAPVKTKAAPAARKSAKKAKKKPAQRAAAKAGKKKTAKKAVGKAARKSAKKSAKRSAKKSVKKSSKKTARKTAGKKQATKKSSRAKAGKTARKSAPSRKTAAKSKAAGKKKATKKRSAAKSAKRPARKAVRKK